MLVLTDVTTPKSKSFQYMFYTSYVCLVLSGEEEAIFSWAATNFLMGTLLPASQGDGVVQVIFYLLFFQVGHTRLKICFWLFSILTADVDANTL